jgi:hypothetical protein
MVRRAMKVKDLMEPFLLLGECNPGTAVGEGLPAHAERNEEGNQTTNHALMLAEGLWRMSIRSCLLGYSRFSPGFRRGCFRAA